MNKHLYGSNNNNFNAIMWLKNPIKKWKTFKFFSHYLDVVNNKFIVTFNIAGWWRTTSDIWNVRR